MEDQRKILIKEFNEWKKEEDQTDDVTRDWSSALNLILVILPLRKSTQTFQNQLDQDQYYWFY